MATKTSFEFLIEEGTPNALVPPQEDRDIAPEPGPVRGLTIASLTLNKDYDPRIARWFGGQNEIYFVASSFMFGDEKPFVWPAAIDGGSQAFMEMKQHETWRFDDLGSGAPLFPERELKSGVCVAVHVMESDENRRKAGEKMKAAADAVKTDGSIAKILKDAIANPGKVTADIALGAAMEVANVIGSVLTKDGDDAVGLFSSYFEMRASWDGHLKADRGGCSIELHEVKG